MPNSELRVKSPLDLKWPNFRIFLKALAESEELGGEGSIGAARSLDTIFYCWQPVEAVF